jgi:hypothetical protein
MTNTQQDACGITKTGRNELGSMMRHRLFVDVPKSFAGTVHLKFRAGEVDDGKCTVEDDLVVK